MLVGLQYFIHLVGRFLQIITSSAVGNKKRVSASKPSSSNYEQDPVYLVQGGYRPQQHTLAKYVASIRRYDFFYIIYFGGTHMCGGTILSPLFVLTATHCLTDFRKQRTYRPSELLVAVRNPRRLDASLGRLMSVKSVIVHYGFDIDDFSNDIGLIKLNKEILIDNTYAQALPLPTYPPVEGAVCTSLGWGRLYWTGPLANEILYVDLTILDKTSCTAEYSVFNGNQICVADPNNGNNDVCAGDSGGPLICNGSVTGVVSYGNACGDAKPTVFANVFMYIDWIKACLL